MKKIEAIIRPSKIEEIKDELDKYGIKGMTVTTVTGCGHQKGYRQIYRGKEYTMNLLHKIKIELIVQDNQMEDIISILQNVARTGEVGDGKIFIYEVINAVKIRTGERGEAAL